MRKVKLKLDEVLKERKITQEQLSSKTGIRQAAISELCRNYKKRVQIDHLERICDALDIDDITELIVIEEVAENEDK